MIRFITEPNHCPDQALIADLCDPQCYFHCAANIAYHYCCAAGTLWDDSISNCQWAYLIFDDDDDDDKKRRQLSIKK